MGAVTFFCEVVMLAKEVAKHERERLAADMYPCRRVGDARCVRRLAAIFGYSRRGLADGEQRVACCPIRTKSRAPQGAVSTNCRGPINRVNCLTGPREPFKGQTACLSDGATEETGRDLVSRSLTLLSAPPRARLYLMTFPAPHNQKTGSRWWRGARDRSLWTLEGGL